MKSLTVGLGSRSYAIHIGADLIHSDTLLSQLAAQFKRAVIVTNSTVGPLYLDRLQQSLSQAGLPTDAITLPDGEQFKTSQYLNQIYDELLALRSERSTPLIALGGGVVGDMTGFAAATYLRGVPFIQVPTTLLSQVDSSVGGKTGINHPAGKNMIGAFYQPQMVLADSSTLNTLPDSELSAGIAEVIKYGLIRDAEFFEWLEQHIEGMLQRDPEVLATAIERSCQNKAAVVAADELEKGERALLNLGHTFGHAIESAMGYGNWLHGEAVAAGTVIAARLSVELGMLNETQLPRIIRLFERARLPVVSPDISVEQYLELMALDKKVEHGQVRFVLLETIGRAVIRADVPLETLKSAIRLS